MKIKYPHMKYMRYDIINHLIKHYNYSSYLEIGTRKTKDNFDKILIKKKECIDPKPLSKLITYRMTSDKAFEIIKKKNKTFDIIFIDGLHLSEQVDIDIKNSLDILNDNGIIILHDCNPIHKECTKSYERFLKEGGS